MHIHDIVENFTLQDSNGSNVSLADFVSSPVVIFFYPRADTSGCTIEACNVRDNFEKLKVVDAIVLGISRDTIKVQRKFADKYNLSYPLLADPEEKVCRYFGVIRPKNMYGKLVSGIERITFVIAPLDYEGRQRILQILALLQKSR